MANAVTADAPQEGRSNKPGKRKKLIVLVMMAVLAGGGGFFAMRTLSAPASATPEVAPTPIEGAVIDVAEMTASLPGELPHLARVGFAVVLEEGVDPATVTPRFALLKDAAVTELAESSAELLITPEGVDDLRARLTGRAVEVYPDGEVLRVVLTQLVVQ